MDCPKCGWRLDEVLENGVLVDRCSSCRGTWLDKGEITFFVKDPRKVDTFLEKRGLILPKDTLRGCPHCDGSLIEGALIDENLLVDQCNKCEGIWFDRDEIENLNKILGSKFSVDAQVDFTSKAVRPADAPTPQTGAAPPATTPKTGGPLPKLPSLGLRSVGVFIGLYGMVTLMMIILAETGVLGLNTAIGIAVGFTLISYLLGPFITDLMLRWLQSMHWVDPGDLPANLRSFIEKVVQEKGIPFPKMGIIEDGTPNAFTYGHTPKNARIILTRGLMDILDEDELEAVVAHELGHAIHWDILVMTMASMVPILLYYIFRLAMESSRGKSSKNNPLPVIGIAAFVLYIIANYVVLFLSRVREYWADRFAGEVTSNPGSLASALVKIAYGLAGAKQGEGEKSSESRMTGMKALGIFDPSSAKTLAAVSAGKSAGGANATSRENILGAMQWDLWNPWAKWYEFNSTHPLPANRLEMLGKQASSMGQEAFIHFNLKKPESYWDEFLVDLSVMLLPWLGLVGGLAAMGFAGGQYFGLAILGVGAGKLIKVLFRYRGGYFPAMNVATLLKNVKVSGIRPVPVKLKGKVIGRGIPGLVYSEDLVLQDETGFMFMDYRQPLRFIEFLFGLFRAKGIIGRDVQVEGWYRRSPTPYVEMKTLRYGNKTSTCYVYHIKLLFSGILTCAGLVLTLGALFGAV